ncbi:MAG: hypothetical protein V4772_12210 [Pseudomonadota bacterium]
MKITPTANKKLILSCLFLMLPTMMIFIILWRHGMHSAALIEHDDWPFLIGNWDLRSKLLLEEGRPLNYLWYQVSHRVLTPETAVVLYWILFAKIALSFARILAVESFLAIGVLAAVVLFSPEVIELSGWPAYVLAGLFITSVGTHLISRLVSNAGAAGNDRKRLWFVGVFSFLAYQFYPAFAFIVLIVSTAQHDVREPAFYGKLCTVFVMAIFLSTLAIFFVNYVSFGRFGVIPGSWREPRYATDIWSFLQNERLLIEKYRELVERGVLVWSVGLVGFVSQLFMNPRKCLVLCLVAVLPFGFDVLLVGLTGVVPDVRHFLWIPIVAVALAADLPRYLSRRWMIATGVLAGITGVFSLNAHAVQKAACNSLFENVQRVATSIGQSHVLILGAYSNDRSALVNRLTQAGRAASLCRSAECLKLQQHNQSIFRMPGSGAVAVSMREFCASDQPTER